MPASGGGGSGGYPGSHAESSNGSSLLPSARASSAPPQRPKTRRPRPKQNQDTEAVMLERALHGETRKEAVVKKREYLRLFIRRFEDNAQLFEVTISPKASVRQLHACILDRLAGEDGSFNQPVKLLCNKVQLYIDDRMLDEVGVTHRVAVHIARTRRRCVFLSNATDGSVKLWSGRSFRCLTSMLHSKCVNSARLSPDGTLVVTTCLDGACRVWCSASGVLVSTLRGHKGTMTYADVCPDGEYVATASEDCSVRIWCIDRERCTGILTGHQAPVNMVLFSPDGNLLATASRDRTACLWERDSSDMGEAKPVMPLIGHTDRINSVSWASRSNLIVTTSADRTARIWDVQTGACRQVFGGLDVFLAQAEFTSGDTMVFTCSPNGVVRLWAVGAVGSSECLRVYRMGCAIIGCYVSGGKVYVLLQEERKEGNHLKVYCPDDDEPPLTFYGHTGCILAAKMSIIQS